MRWQCHGKQKSHEDKGTTPSDSNPKTTVGTSAHQIAEKAKCEIDTTIEVPLQDVFLLYSENRSDALCTRWREFSDFPAKSVLDDHVRYSTLDTRY